MASTDAARGAKARTFFVSLGYFVSFRREVVARELLAPHSAVMIAGAEQFVAADAFKVGNSIGGRTVGAVGWNFAEHFLPAVEHDVPATTVRVWTLEYAAGDKALIEILGGQENAGVLFLAYVYRVMDLGDRGPSHRDGSSNFAYVPSAIDRRLRAVHWSVNDADEWIIGGVHVPHPDMDWRYGSRVFSR